MAYGDPKPRDPNPNVTTKSLTAAGQRKRNPSYGPPPATGSAAATDHGDSLIDTYRIWFFKQNRINPIRGLSFEMLVSRLDEWYLGYLKRASLLMDAVMHRDNTMMTVVPKRKAALGRKSWQVLIKEGFEDDPEAKDQQETLKYFYNNLRVSHVVEQNRIGGVSLLAKQMMDAVGMKYAVHEILWRQSSKGITATLNQVPLWFFEDRTGRLRFLPVDTAWDGIDLDEFGWMVTMGDGIMEACAILYCYKTMSLKDWSVYNEKHGMPWVFGRTKYAPNSAVFKALEKAVASIGKDFSAVINSEDEIEKMEAGAQGELPFPGMVDWASRGIAALWRGADLSTISAHQGDAGQGASIQGEESDQLEDDDCQMVSETCQLQLDHLCLRLKYGNDVEPKSYFSFGGGGQVNAGEEIQIDTALYAMGYPLSQQEMSERYGRKVPEPDEEILQKPAQAPGTPGGNGFGGFDAGAPARNGNGELNPTQIFADELLSNDPKTRKMVKVARERLAKSEARVLQPIRSRLEKIVAIANETEFRQALKDFRQELPTLLLKVNQRPDAQRELERIMTAALLNGMHEGIQPRRR